MACSEENEDVLRRMRAQGDDLTQSRDIDFAVVFPDESSARGFADQLDVADLSVSIEKADKEGSYWDVIVTKNMVPENDAITDFEELLADSAIMYGGRNEGWGCFNTVSKLNIQ